MTTVSVPRLVLQPGVYSGMQRGIRQIVEAIRPTLGPVPRMVAISRADRRQSPELLDHGALIARRIISVSDRDADVGAMFIRHLLWRLYQDVGDGTATAAVLFEAIFRQGVQHVTAGGNAMRLRRYLEQGQQAMQAEIATRVMPVEAEDELAQIAETSCHDVELAQALGEIFAVIGPYGELRVVNGHGRELEQEFVEGMHFDGGLLSGAAQSGRTVELDDAAILLTDLSIQNPRELIPLLQQANRAGIRSVVIVATAVAEVVHSMLLSVNQTPENFRVIAVKTPGSTTFDQTDALKDLAVVTGATPVFKATGEALETIPLTRLGRAAHLWANRTHFAIVDEAENTALDRHRQALRDAAERAADMDGRERYEKRLGHLIGGSANLRVGGITEADIDARKDLAKRASAAVRGALREGTVSGGGSAILACQVVLRQRWQAASDEDERAAYRILMQAVEAPTRALVANAGHDPDLALAELRARCGQAAFDARTGVIVPLADYSVRDAAHVVQAAVRTAVVSAALALTVDVMVHHKNPEQVTEP